MKPLTATNRYQSSREHEDNHGFVLSLSCCASPMAFDTSIASRRTSRHSTETSAMAALFIIGESSTNECARRPSWRFVSSDLGLAPVFSSPAACFAFPLRCVSNARFESLRQRNHHSGGDPAGCPRA